MDDLRRIPLFSSLKDEQIETLRQAAVERNFIKKQVIFVPENTENYILIVLEGKVRVYLSYPNGKDFSVAFLEPGDVYSSHSHTFAEALRETRIWAVDISRFYNFMLNNQALLLSMTKVLGESLGNTLRIIESLVFMDVDQRLARFLLENAAFEEQRGDNSEAHGLNLTVEEIASAVGTSRQTASMLLSRWKKSGMLASRHKSLIVEKPDQLRKIFQTQNHY